MRSNQTGEGTSDIDTAKAKIENHLGRGGDRREVLWGDEDELAVLVVQPLFDKLFQRNLGGGAQRVD